MGIIQRQSKISGQSLVQGLVFGFLDNPQASEVQLAQSVGRAGIPVTSQAVNARLTERTAKFFQKVLERMTQIVIQPDVKAQTLLDRFSEVNVNDSTTISLPNGLSANGLSANGLSANGLSANGLSANGLSEVWTGCSNRTEHGRAALKLQAHWDLRSGALKMLTLHDGRAQDRSAPAQTIQKADILPNSLRLADLGYFDLSLFARIGQSQAFWLTRYLSGVNIFTEADAAAPVCLAEWLEHHCTRTHGVEVDLPVAIGSKDRLPARLIAIRVPQQVADERRRKLHDKARGKGQTVSQLSLALANWSIFLTHIPESRLTLDEILVIARIRWQIELLFKLCKSSGRIDESRSSKPFRILCELYAKMIGQLIQHWLIIYPCWSFPDRSMVKAATAISSCATCLLVALLDSSTTAISSAIDLICRSVASTCRISKRSKKHALFQLLTLDHP